MSTTLTKKNNPVYAGVFVVAMMALLVLLALFVGRNALPGDNKVRYEVIYDTSIKGLDVGAPVTLRGVTIGEVSDIKAKLHSGRDEVLNSVYIDIYPDTVVRSDEQIVEKPLSYFIDRGLAAKLRTQSLLTGLLYMEVDFYSEEAKVFPVETDFPQLPTVPTDFESFSQGIDELNLPGLLQDVRSVAASLSAIASSEELQKVPQNLNQALDAFEIMSQQMGQSMEDIRNEFVPMSKSMNSMSSTIERQVPETFESLNRVLADVEQSLQALEATAVALGDTVAPDSPLIYQLQRSSSDISKSARSVQQLADMLEEQPRSLWSGKRELTK